MLSLLGPDVLRVRPARELWMRSLILWARVPEHHVCRAVRADPDVVRADPDGADSIAGGGARAMNDRDAFAESLLRLPGFVGAGVVLQNPRTPRERFEIYEVRWLRGQPIPSLPPRIEGRPVKLVVVDDYPRPQAPISGEGLSVGGTATTVLVFAAFALPVGLLLSKMQEARQLEAEKAQFQRIGLDWSQRSR